MTEQEKALIKRWIIENVCSGMVGADEGNDEALICNMLQCLQYPGDWYPHRLYKYLPEQNDELRALCLPLDRVTE